MQSTFSARLLRAKLAKGNKKNFLQKGFTLVELMVVVAIVGVLSAVALPNLTAAKGEAESSAAKQEVVNAAKTCTIALLADNAADGDVIAVTDGNVTNIATTCADSATFAFSGGTATWTIDMVDGIAGTPVKS